MKQAETTLGIETTGHGLYEFTRETRAWVSETAIQRGLLTAFCRHTSASLCIQENADPDVLADLEAFYTRLVSTDPTLYRHASEGVDDMPAHIKSTLTDVSLSVPVSAGQPVLGTWQGLFLFEHRTRPNRREVVLHLMGE